MFSKATEKKTVCHWIGLKFFVFFTDLKNVK